MASKKQATEANEDMMRDAQVYEFAFHILPTVAGTEVADVVSSLKTLITKEGGEILDTEDPQRIELAYEIDKVIDGAHKRFHSAYFGWIRMRISAEGLITVKDELDHVSTILRSLIVKLSKEEIEHPFKYHENVRKTERRSADATDEVVEGAPVADVAEAEVDVVTDDVADTTVSSDTTIA